MPTTTAIYPSVPPMPSWIVFAISPIGMPPAMATNRLASNRAINAWSRTTITRNNSSPIPMTANEIKNTVDIVL